MKKFALIATLLAILVIAAVLVVNSFTTALFAQAGGATPSYLPVILRDGDTPTSTVTPSPTITPTATVTPTVTPSITPTKIPLPTLTLTPTGSPTPTTTTTPLPPPCNTQFVAPLVAGDTIVFVTGEVGTYVTLYDITDGEPGVVIGTGGPLIYGQGYACPGFFPVNVSPPLIVDHVIRVFNNTDGTEDMAIVLPFPSTPTPTWTGTPFPTGSPTPTSTPTWTSTPTPTPGG